MAERFEAELQQPFGLVLKLADASHHIFIEALRDDVGLKVAHEAIAIFLASRLLND